ncbi:calpain-C-like protein [Dinothrombium tinctorium]|uniref:Calpain-C-like protein n=1 Tax=Dinothrombium tinctorium TaxID=1965070 RepID=A0A3S3NSL9_9ACAR|nr:calpain-C-like protein [Dinothrombium tinctorium]RWS05237.1 calpain-C-like protein [Dinothrombium tinctorium]
MSDSEFERIRRHCLKAGQLYEDPDFSTNQSSVFYHQTPPFTFVWKRPKEIYSNPVFLDEDPKNHNFDVTPGRLGDSWFVSCIGCLNLTKGLFYRVVPADQSFNDNEYAGIFRFRIWWHGEWKEVLIDDRLPTVNNKLVFIQSLNSNYFWAPLLEKAYAKLHGSYEALKYGSTMEGLSDLSGGVTENISLKTDPNSFSLLLIKLLSMTSVVTAIVQKENFNNTSLSPKNSRYERLANGITLSVNYRVINFEKLTTNEGEVIQLIRLRNPLITCPAYIGAWSQGAPEWERLSNKERTNLTSNLAEGEFYMSYQDFMKTFTNLQVIHLDSETSKDEPSLKGKKAWCIRLWKGIWRKGVTAGGCRNNFDTFHLNPQLLLHINDKDEVIISLNQHSVIDAKVVGFSLYQSTTNDERLDRNFFKRNRSYFNSDYTNSKGITARCKLEPGFYVLLPTTYEPGQEGMFSLRIYSSSPLKLSCLDANPSVLKPAIIKAPPSFDSKFSQYETMFMQLADEHKTVNAFELQELLECCLPNDYVKSCATIEVCRQIVTAMDIKGFGRLHYNDYKNIMCSLKYWQNIFRNHTKGTSGILRAEKMQEALLDIGFQLNNEILSLLMLKYMRKDGTLRFGDFVSCILHLNVIFALFEKKDAAKSGSIVLSLPEWIKASLLS